LVSLGISLNYRSNNYSHAGKKGENARNQLLIDRETPNGSGPIAEKTFWAVGSTTREQRKRKQ
jgi:hypothetical protein